MKGSNLVGTIRHLSKWCAYRKTMIKRLCECLPTIKQLYPLMLNQHHLHLVILLLHIFMLLAFNSRASMGEGLTIRGSNFIALTVTIVAILLTDVIRNMAFHQITNLKGRQLVIQKEEVIIKWWMLLVMFLLVVPLQILTFQCSQRINLSLLNIPWIKFLWVVLPLISMRSWCILINNTQIHGNVNGGNAVVKPFVNQTLAYQATNNGVAGILSKPFSSLWILDSGSTDHIVCSTIFFTSYFFHSCS